MSITYDILDRAWDDTDVNVNITDDDGFNGIKDIDNDNASFEEGTLTDVEVVNDNLELEKPLYYGRFDDNFNLTKNDDTSITPDSYSDLNIMELEGLGGAVAVEEATTNLANAIENHNPHGLYEEIAMSSPCNDKVIKYTAQKDDDYTAWIDCDFSPTKSEEYTISIYAKGDNGGEKLELYFGENDGSTYHYISKTFNLTTSWERYHFTLTTRSDITSLRYRIDNNINGDIIYLSGLQIEKQPYASAFVSGSRNRGILTYDILNTSEFTIHAKIKPNIAWDDTTTSNNASEPYIENIFNWGNAGSDGFLLRIDRDANQRMDFYYGQNSITFETSFEGKEWVCVDIVFDGSILKLYLNGILEAITGQFAIPTSNILKFYRPNYARFGYYDDFAFFNYKLNSNKINKLYNQNTPVSIFGQGNRLSPQLDLSTVGTIASSQISWQDHSGLSFDGVDDWIEANSVSEYIADSSFTLEYTFKTISTSNLHTLSFNTSTGNRILLGVNDGYHNVYDGSHHLGSKQINDNRLHRASVTFNYRTGEIVSYIDGVEDSRYTTSRVIDSSDRFSIGQEFDGVNPSQFFNGLINDIRIYNRALTQQEIQDNMYTELTGNETGLVAYYKADEGTGTTLTDYAGNNDGTINGASWVSTKIETSTDGGSTWDTVTNGGSIPNIEGANTLDVRQTLSTDDTTVTPVLESLTVEIETPIQYKWSLDTTNPTSWNIFELNDVDDDSVDFNEGTLTNVETSNSYLQLTTGSSTGNRVSPQLDISNLDNISSSLVNFSVDNYTNDKGLEFNGTSDYVDCNIQLQDTGSMTLEAVVKLNSLPASGTKEVIASNYDTDNSGLTLQVTDTGQVEVVIYHAFTGDELTVISSNSLTTDEFYTVAFTKGTSNFTVHIEGVEEGLTGLIEPFKGNTQNTLLGARDNAGLERYFDGVINEVRFWDVQLSENDLISNLSTEFTGTETDLNALYKFEDDSNTSSVVESVGTSDGTNNGATYVTTKEVVIETSVDGGSSWQTVNDGDSIPNLTDGDTTVDVRQTLSTADTSLTPQLQSLEVSINGDVTQSSEGQWYLHTRHFENNSPVTEYQGTYDIDKTPPVVPNVTLVNNTSHSFSLSWTNSDSLSGIDYVELYAKNNDGTVIDIDGDSNTEDYITLTSTDETYTVDGLNEYDEYDYKVITYDKAGNSTEDGFYTMITDDITEPVIGYSLNSRDWLNTDVDETVNVDDTGGSGVAQAWYKWTNSATQPTDGWVEMGTTTDFNTGRSQEGEWYLHIKAVDNSGNTAFDYSGAYKIDKTAPDITATSVSIDNPTGVYDTYTATVEWTIGDQVGLSGVDRTEIGFYVDGTWYYDEASLPSGITVDVDMDNVTGSGNKTAIFSNIPREINIGASWQGYDVATNNTTEEQTGVASSLSFDGVDDYAEIPFILPDIGTIEIWYYPKSFYNFNSIWSNSVDANNWECWVYDTGVLRARLNHASVSFDLNNLNGINSWYHLAFSWQKNGDIKLYINGIIRDSSSIISWVIPGNKIYLGGMNNVAGYSFMSSFRIWNTARTEQEIKDNMYKDLTGKEEGLVAYYPMDEVTGSTLIDKAGTNDGKIYGATWADENGNEVYTPRIIESGFIDYDTDYTFGITGYLDYPIQVEIEKITGRLIFKGRIFKQKADEGGI